MPSLVFDQAVSYYDRTRALAPAHAAAFNLGLIAHGGLDAASRVLEVGVGTGRIATPLLACGIQVIGLDLSRPMMQALHRKWPQAALAQADAVQLPLARRTFDAVVMVHVLHLIAGWKEALADVARALRPGGVLLHGWQDYEPSDMISQLGGRFFELTEARGETGKRPGASDRDEVIALWTELSWAHEAIEIVTWEDSQSAQQFIDLLASRHWSSTWTLSDATFTAALAELVAWARSEIGDLQAPHPRHHKLMLDVVRPTREA